MSSTTANKNSKILTEWNQNASSDSATVSMVLLHSQ